MLLVVVVTEGPVHTLEESAAAEQAKRKKVSLEEVDVKTGEENEYNVFQVTQLSGLSVIVYSLYCDRDLFRCISWLPSCSWRSPLLFPHPAKLNV